MAWPENETAYLCLNCSAIYLSGLFWHELVSFGDDGFRDVSLSFSIMERDGLALNAGTHRRKTHQQCYFPQIIIHLLRITTDPVVSISWRDFHFFVSSLRLKHCIFKCFFVAHNSINTALENNLNRLERGHLGTFDANVNSSPFMLQVSGIMVFDNRCLVF